MEEKPVVKNFKDFGFVVKSWYHDGEGKMCHTASSYKTVARAMEICNGVVAGKIRTYNGFVIEGCEFQGKKYICDRASKSKDAKPEETDF